MLSEGKRERLPRIKRKRERVALTFEAKFHSTTRPRVRTHERNETISQLDSPPPTSDIYREREREIERERERETESLSQRDRERER